MKSAAKILIVVFMALVARKIRKADRLDRLFVKPPIREHEDERITLNPDRSGVGWSHRPRCHEDWGGFDIQE
jgi:hypothetical protein